MSFDNRAGNKGLWVFIEQKDNKPARVSLELLGKGRVLADKLDVEMAAILIGQDVSGLAQELVYYGADWVIMADEPIARDYRTEVYTDIIAKQVLQKRPEILLVGATPIGRDLAPRLSARLGTGCNADCTELDIDKVRRLIVATKPFFGRNLMADMICPYHRPQMVTVRPGVFELRGQDKGRKGVLTNIDVDMREENVRVKVIDTVRPASEGMSLEEADKVIVGGMGVGDRKGFEMLKELSVLLGAELGATSLPVDKGWISKDYQIGQTGKTISPRLYLGCGVSGAIQHSVGMINSELIIAININPKAEIFEFADYAILGDVNQVVPALINSLTKKNKLKPT
jgi:electron transfer flavoprotein alpha subunit